MKRTHTCPKCQSRRFLVSANFQIPGQESSNATFPVPAFTFNIGAWTRASFGAFETWVCAGCGFTEWYAVDLAGLDISKAKDTVRYVDATAPGSGYR